MSASDIILVERCGLLVFHVLLASCLLVHRQLIYSIYHSFSLVEICSILKYSTVVDDGFSWV